MICIQEPSTYPGTRTQNHPGYDCYAPIESWESTDATQREAERPRVITYVRKGAGLRTQQRCLIHNRDLLWLDVNGYAILNVYRMPVREPVPNDIIHYITHLSPPPSCLIGGDFNALHDMFEPGVRPSRNGPDLAR